MPKPVVWKWLFSKHLVCNHNEKQAREGLLF